MGSTDLKGRSELAKKNTFQRMLDLEQKNKMNRMQASQHIPHVHTSTVPGRDSISNRDFRPSTLEQKGRAMTSPALSISIPTPMSSNGTPKKYVISQSGDLIPQEEEVSEDDSDTSSICHSPGWDNITGKKKKQEKQEKKARDQRRREKEKAEKEAKQAQKAMVKLSKAPPANSSKKLTRTSVTIDRSNTAPVLSTAADAPTPVKELSQPRQSTSTRPRRGSLEVGLKSFISARTSMPWKTSHNPSSQATPVHEFVPARSTSKVASGFIGGLKLRQSEEAAAQDIIRKVKIGGGDEAKGLLSTDTLLKSSTHLSSRASITDSVRPISIYEESIRTPQQWEEVYSQAAILARGRPPIDPTDDNTPIMERNIKKKGKRHPPTSRYFPLESEDSSSSKRGSSIASTRNSLTPGTPTSVDKGDQGQTPSSIVSTDRPVAGVRNSLMDPPRGRSGSYVSHQRKQSRDQSLARYQNEVHVLEVNGDSKRPSSSKGSFFRRLSRSRDSSREASSAVRPRTRDSNVDLHVKEAIVMNPFLNDEYVVPQLHLGDFTASPLDENPTRHRKASSKTSQSLPGLNGLRIITKAAFSKPPPEKSTEKQSGDKLPVPPSPTGSFVSAVETQTIRQSISERTLTTSALDDRDLNTKAEPVPPTIVQDFALPPKSTFRSSPDTIRPRPPKENDSSRKGSGNPSPNISTGNSSTTSHSRSTTDSSEEYSTLDEFSNITTPAISRPQSEKGYSVSVDDLRRKPSRLRKKSSTDHGIGHNGLNGHPMMTGAIPIDDVASNRESWCRTALPMDLTSDEDRMKTPTGKKSVTDFTTQRDEAAVHSDGPPPKTSDGLGNSSGIQRKPSLARSISTPDLQQDLSFLPTLKHQALTKPQKKGKGFLNRKNKQASVSNDPEKPTSSLVRPPPITLPGTAKSEGSSPTSPQPPSQYLQNARLNIGGPRSPKSAFPHSGNPHLNSSGAEPVAKMFVVCCSCKYFHDMPSKIYECMAKPDNVVTDTKLGVSGVISTSVKCPWCGHGMSTSCCAGYAAVVYLREKFH
ncbi:hypothetical protein EG329_003970 [Mollisiaceae sp. DMI_Dod_QoI]|nr:hypothetical protein EG329_003970 [Helotiales sp. DMI_Dod_QoI]